MASDHRWSSGGGAVNRPSAAKYDTWCRIWYQLLVYVTAASSASRSEAPWPGSITVAAAVTTMSIRASAGNRRRARRDQKSFRLSRPTRSYWVASRSVIRNPLSTKNTSTPRNPPDSSDAPSWKPMTASTASARTPSSPGARLSELVVVVSVPAGLLFGQVVTGVMLTSGYRSSQEKRRVTGIELLGAEQVPGHPGQVIAHRRRGLVRVARPQRGHDLLVVLPVLITPGGVGAAPLQVAPYPAVPGALDLGVQPDQQRAAGGRDDRPVQRGVPDLELVVVGGPLAAAQAAVHLVEVPGRRPRHDQGHGGRLEQPPDRHHVGRRVVVRPRARRSLEYRRVRGARRIRGATRIRGASRARVRNPAQERAPAHLA